DSLHLYNRDFSKVGIAEEIVLENNDSLSLCKEETEKMFREIYERMKTLTFPDIVENDICSLAKLGSEYDAYNNIMLIIASYVAKKKQNDDLVTELMKECTNKLYVAMWNRWKDRKRI
ncbi:MAG: hypothetical protein NC304_09465, partial [Robinsoniella sp.]|nr:hypothetical protein [Robinsoniella sp.]